MAAAPAFSSTTQAATGMGPLAAQRKDSIARSMSRYRRRGAKPAPGGLSASRVQPETAPLVGASTETVPSPETPRSFAPNEEEAREVYARGGTTHQRLEPAAHGRRGVAVRERGPIQNHSSSNAKNSGLIHSRGPAPEDISRSTSTRKRSISEDRQQTQAFAPEDTAQRSSLSDADNMFSRCLPLKREKPPSEKPSHVPTDSSAAAMGPGIDAPVSAVNAGERTVLVRFGPAEAILTVTPSTTAVDLIYSAAFSFSQKIHPQNALLKESFEPLGLERPIRIYERIRDILNSWDTDALNSLMLVPAGVDEDNDDLQVRAAPRTRPPEITVHLYHSQKPGKWDKRFITIRSDGQVVSAKKEGAKDKDAVNICHLSDFDIYQPTARQLSKKLKPPKKYCYAIKSQQKSSMFLSKENFVHFFCTSDRRLAMALYKAVQQWRSWYLVNIMGEGRQSPKSAEKTIGYVFTNARSNSLGDQQRPKSATGSDGVARPLLDLRDAHIVEARNRSSLAQSKEMSLPQAPMSTKAMHDRAMSLRQHGPPPVSFPTRLIERTNSITSRPRGSSLQSPLQSESDEEPAFAPNGLLGRTYSQRQKAMQDNHEAGAAGGNSKRRSQDLADGRDQFVPSTTATAHNTDGAKTAGSTGLSRSSSTRSRAESLSGSGVKRGPSLRQQQQMPKPLVDLSPAYREPPQHARKGRGVVVDHVPAGGLVEIANNPAEVAIQVPPATTWRRPRTADDTIGVPVQRRDTVSRRDQANRGSHAHHRPHGLPDTNNTTTTAQTASGDDRRDPFIGGGLLAQAPLSRGGSRRGRGVMDGSHATGPMLDMRERSQFAPGSLLAKVEKDRPAAGPTISRDKGREVVVGVGEAAR